MLTQKLGVCSHWSDAAAYLNILRTRFGQSISVALPTTVIADQEIYETMPDEVAQYRLTLYHGVVTQEFEVWRLTEPNPDMKDEMISSFVCRPLDLPIPYFPPEKIVVSLNQEAIDQLYPDSHHALINFPWVAHQVSLSYTSRELFLTCEAPAHEVTAFTLDLHRALKPLTTVHSQLIEYIQVSAPALADMLLCPWPTLQRLHVSTH